MDELDKNKQDKILGTAKALISLVPYAGSFINEVITNFIPNQRMDRISNYLKILNQKIEQLPSSLINQYKNDPAFIDLIEESFVHASRATTESRLQHITSIVTHGLSDKEVDFQRSKVILDLFRQVSDIEIIWLKYYDIRKLNEAHEYMYQHKNVLYPIEAILGADEETLNKAYIQKNYRHNLIRLRLIEEEIEMDYKNNRPQYDHSGLPVKKSPQTTWLGKMLLKWIS